MLVPIVLQSYVGAANSQNGDHARVSTIDAHACAAVLTDKQKESLCRLLARRGVALGQLAR